MIQNNIGFISISKSLASIGARLKPKKPKAKNSKKFKLVRDNAHKVLSYQEEKES